MHLLRAGLVASIPLLVLGCGGASDAAKPEAPIPTGSASTATSHDPPPAKNSGVLQLACGDFHSCALMADHTVKCWGRNRGGELGDGSTEDKAKPGAVAGLTDVEEIALGANFSCARLKDRSVKCWGTGRVFTAGTISTKTTPTVVAGVSNAVELKAGGYMACARMESGNVTCWGLEKKPGGEPKNAVGIATAATHACAKLKDGSLKCWGEGVWVDGKGAFAKPSVAGADAVTTGDTFACAVTGGTVACWGRNDSGELGIAPDFDDHRKPTAVPSVRGVKQISSAESHSCAISNDGALTCWGDNAESEMGRGTQTTSESPGAVANLTAVLEVAVGTDHVCARTASEVQCWGSNRAGQLGEGTTERRMVPTKVSF
ncbi:hypothetical protein BH09MYX1_BH09MYX1_39220 [soil metagenome]